MLDRDFFLKWNWDEQYNFLQRAIESVSIPPTNLSSCTQLLTNARATETKLDLYMIKLNRLEVEITMKLEEMMYNCTDLEFKSKLDMFKKPLRSLIESTKQAMSCVKHAREDVSRQLKVLEIQSQLGGK